MRAGTLRNLVNVQTATLSQSAVGDITETWTTSFQTWANIVPDRGVEYIDATQTQSVVTHKIYIRYDSSTATITPSYRINHDSKNYKIESALYDPRKTMITLLATEEIT